MVSFLVPKLGSHVFTSAAISVQDGNIIGDLPGEQVCVTRPSMEAMDEDGPGPEWGRIKTQAIYSLTGRSNHIFLDGAFARGRGESIVKPYT